MPLNNKQYKRKVFYYTDIQFIETQKICRFCTRTVYFDSQHVNIKKKGIPHDWPVENYRDPYNIPHHGDHCPDINGTAADRAYYAALRVKKGMPDPWYHTKIPPDAESDPNEPTAEETQEAFNQKAEALNQRHTIPDPPHPTTEEVQEAYHQSHDHEEIPSITEKQASLLHRRINNRKQEIADLKEVVRTLEVQTDILTKSFNDYIYTMGKALRNLGEEAHTLVMDEIANISQKDIPKSLKHGERLDDYVSR